ncbi:hypothetical protein Hanom_Chr09g00813491 [Helianthus anomalus]
MSSKDIMNQVQVLHSSMYEQYCEKPSLVIRHSANPLKLAPKSKTRQPIKSIEHMFNSLQP